MGGSIFSSEVSLTCPQSFILRLVREKSLSISKRLSSTEFGLPNIVLFHTLSLFLCLCLFPLSNSSTQEHTRTHTHTLYWDPNESQIMCLLRNFSIFFYSTEFFYFYFDFLSPPQKKSISVTGIFHFQDSTNYIIAVSITNIPQTLVVQQLMNIKIIKYFDVFSPPFITIYISPTKGILYC